MGRNITPYIRIEADSKVVVSYEISFAKTQDPKFLDTVKLIADSAVNIFGSQSKVLSSITKAAVSAKLAELEQNFTKRLTIKAEDNVTADFDFRTHKGINVCVQRLFSEVVGVQKLAINPMLGQRQMHRVSSVITDVVHEFMHCDCPPLRSPTIRPQSLISPSTRVTLAP